ncbi:MAG: gliding motility-associated C-terminal domain-containing protein [Bacteroidales bacterium]
MNKLFSATILIFTLLVFTNTKAQFVLTGKIGNVPTDVYHMCKGDSLDLNSSKSDYLMNNNFNSSTIGTGWSTNVTAIWSNPCPPTGLPAEGVALWLGANVFPRELVTVGYDIHCYSTCHVEFDMKYGANQNTTNCESPDLTTEGVHLMYSITGGAPWTQFSGIDVAPIGTFGTGGYVNGTGGYWTPVANNAATGPYYTWNHYKSQIPAAAFSTNTKIRWYQDLASGNNFDHWGIDNVQISCPTQPYLEWSCTERPSWHYYDFNPPAFIADQAGTFHYIVSIIDLINNNHCPQIDTITVVVHDPKVNVISDFSICYGDTTLLTEVDTSIGPLTYQWNTVPITTTNTLLAYPTSTMMYTLTVKDSINCKAKDSVKVTVNPLPVIVTTNDTICVGDSATLTATGGGTADVFLWSNATTNPILKIKPTVTTVFQIKVTTQYGCKDTSSAFVLVNPSPVLQITNNTTICIGNQIPLTVSGGLSYLWSPTNDTLASITVTPTDPLTTYSVVATDANKCVDSASVDITTIPLPIPTISQETDTICKGAYTTITAGGGTSFLWNTGETTSSVYVRPLSTFMYNVTVSNVLNNVVCSKDISIEQAVRNCNVIYIPNSFSPLGYNTVFKPAGEIVISKSYEFAIYNRWGQMVFETTDISQGWNGRFNGEYVPSGVYIYYIKIDNDFEDPYEKIGTVTVIQ